MDVILSSWPIFALGASFALGAIGAALLPYVIPSRNAGWWGYGWAVIGSFIGLFFAGAVILSGQTIIVANGTITALIPFSLRVDLLSAFFVGVISLVSLFVSIYAFSYQEHFARRSPLGMLAALYSIFVASLFFVVMANHALTFMFFWEIMSLSSYFLVVYEHHEQQNLRAGVLYLIMMHVAAALILLAFLLASRAAGSMSFDAFRQALPLASPITKTTVLLAALLGFGIKAGVVPFHIWLPEAHPAAPSHVSALMSGVMLKVAIFMLVRFFFDFLPGAALPWGIALLALGGISSILGVLYALSEHDIKRLLAYSSVENIGIILLGLGSAVVFAALGMPPASTLALAAALFHTVNHALFKALLFLGAGAVVSGTGTRNMEEHGGLMRLMPYTAAFFLVGALAVAALPPLNGFASEWLTFQAIFAGLASSSLIVKTSFLLAIASLALTGGLAAATFVKAFAIPFLGRSRARAQKRDIHEAAWPMLFGMGGLAVLVVLFGVFAVPVSSIIFAIASRTISASSIPLALPSGVALASANPASMASLTTVVAALLFIAALITLLVHASTRKNSTVLGTTWSSGVPLSQRMEITATGFSRSLIQIFKGVLRPTKQVNAEYRDEASRYFVKSGAVSVGFADPYRIHFYKPLYEALVFIATRVKRIQSGNINVYVVYVFATMMALLIFAVSA